MKIESKIIGLGSYLPTTELDNKAFEKSLETTDQWITQRTGIKTRHIVSPGEMTSDMSAAAAYRAMHDAEIEAQDIDMVIVATTTPDKVFPSCASITSSKIGCKNAIAFDIQAVCSGFIYGLAIANNFIQSESVRTILLIGADSMSKIVDYSDRSTAILFGDGAGAVVIQKNEDHNSTFIRTKLYSDNDHEEILYTDGGISSSQTSGYIKMNGPAVFEHAVKKMLYAANEILAANNLSINDIDLVVPHQANIRIIQALAKHLNIETSKIISTVNLHANTSAASIPLAMDKHWDQASDISNKIILLVAIGAGLTSGAAIVKL